MSMRKIPVLLFACLAAPAMAQIASPSLPAHGNGETMVVRTDGAASTEDFEVQATLSDYLKKAGYNIVPDMPGPQPHYLAIFQVAFDKGSMVAREVLQPEYSSQPPSNSMNSNSMGMDNGMNNGMGMQETPTITTTLTPHTESVRVYRGAFVLDIFDLSGGAAHPPQIYHAGFG